MMHNVAMEKAIATTRNWQITLPSFRTVAKVCGALALCWVMFVFLLVRDGALNDVKFQEQMRTKPAKSASDHVIKFLFS